MRRNLLHVLYLVLLAFTINGCARNYYNLPRETYEKKVRILGIAPIMVDASSEIKHPDKDALVKLVAQANRTNEKELVAGVKNTGVYFSVGLLDEDADQLFSRLFFRRERRDDAGVLYNKYFFKGPELKDLMVKNTLDAVMLVVVSGQTRPEKVYSSNFLSYLESDYNYLIMTAQVVDADGVVLWEYPNFRKRNLSYSPLISLQYPDFDEAQANVTDMVDVKFKTLAGIRRAFEKTENASEQKKGAKVSSLYASVFEDMVALLQPEKKLPWFEKKVEKKEKPKEEEAKKEAPKATEQPGGQLPKE